jgi:hypothetical protein
VSIVNLHARPGESANLSIWRIGITNADTVVDITTDPVLPEVSAVAYTDASGDDQGRIDITLTDDAPTGAYEWTAEIDGIEVFTGTIYVAPHGRPASFVAHSIDINSLTTPAWIIPRPEDVEGESLGEGGSVPDGGTTGQVLTKQSNTDGDATWQDPTGSEGPEGPQGPAGADGADGADGLSLLNGAAAPDNGDGNDGDTYFRHNGEIYTKVAGDWGSPVTDLTGPTGATGATGATGSAGAAGADGRTIRTGTGAPDNGVGANGDLYIDEVDPFAWYVREAGVYDLKGTLKGDDGPQGIQGVPGDDGVDGADGAPGDDGQGVPTGGTANQQLEKIDGTDFNTQWATRHHVPTGGTTGQALVKVDNTDGNTQWATVASSTQQHLVGMAIPGSGLGNNGDTYERLTTGAFWAKSAGAWARSNLVTSHAGMMGLTFEVTPRYNSTNVSNTGGQAASTVFGSAAGVTYVTTNARTSHVRIAFNGAATANTVCSGVLTPQQGIVNVSSSSRHGRFQLKFRFGLASVVAANFRFFCGVITTAGTFSDDPTGAGSVLGDRIGLAIDANTALAAKWIVNYSGANQNNTAAYTLVQDNWYEIVMWTEPLSNIIHMELWEQTTANGTLSVVSSIDFAVTSDIVDIALRPFCAAANAGTAAASCNVHFGGLMGRALFA